MPAGQARECLALPFTLCSLSFRVVRDPGCVSQAAKRTLRNSKAKAGISASKARDICLRAGF